MVEPCNEMMEDEGNADESSALSMKELAGELRWINNLDQEDTGGGETVGGQIL